MAIRTGRHFEALKEDTLGQGNLLQAVLYYVMQV